MNLQDSIEKTLSAFNCSSEKINAYLVPLTATCIKYQIQTPRRIAAFLSQLYHESGGFKLEPSENLNYSEKGLLATFGRFFKPEEAPLFAHKQEKIANRVYANRIGNGPEMSGDGWRYHGRGLIQITGKGNYSSCGITMNLELTKNPDLLLDPINSSMSAGWYWNKTGLNKIADTGSMSELTKNINNWFWLTRGIAKADIPKPEPSEIGKNITKWSSMTSDRIGFDDPDAVPTITRRINGGLNGIDEREELYQVAEKALA